MRQPNLDLIHIQYVGLIKANDPEILRWAAEHDRIVLTHDKATMPVFADERLTKRASMSGLFVISDRVLIRQAIDELLLINESSEQTEWIGLVLYLPL